jgi:hypothetical protein
VSGVGCTLRTALKCISKSARRRALVTEGGIQHSITEERAVEDSIEGTLQGAIGLSPSEAISTEEPRGRHTSRDIIFWW